MYRELLSWKLQWVSIFKGSTRSDWLSFKVREHSELHDLILVVFDEDLSELLTDAYAHIFWSFSIKINEK